MELGVKVTVGEPTMVGSLAIFPLFAAAHDGPPYLCGPDAFSAGLVSVQEADEDGSVGSLLVSNHADLPLLLLEGETVLGLKQNRTFNVSFLCPAGSEVLAPVSCVEAGRWGGANPVVRSARHAPTRLRAVKTSSLIDGPSAIAGRRDSDQDAVWRTVEAYSARGGGSSSETALEAAHDYAATSVAALVERFEVLPEQRGVAVANEGELVAFDLFDKPSTLATYYSALLSGYALDATGKTPTPPTAADVEQFVGATCALEALVTPGVGLGHEFRMSGPDLVAIGLQLEGAVVHLAGFSTPVAVVGAG